MSREAEGTGQQSQGGSSSDAPLVEGSSFWFYIGVLATTYFSAVNIVAAVTMDEFYETLSTVSIPMVILLCIGSFFCQPRRASPNDKWKLRLHFISFAFISEMAWAVYAFREGEIGFVLLHFVRLAVFTLVFHFAFQLRAAAGRLPDKDLETFLVDALFKRGFKTLISILFLTFRTTKCMFEKGGVAKCFDTSFCSTMISVYLLLWWGIKVVQGSVRSEWRKDLNLSIEKIARMRDISLRRRVEGVLTLLTVICGIFLFSMMSASKIETTTVTVVGYIGAVASLFSTISELYSLVKAQNRRLSELQSGLQQETEIEQPVEEVRWERFYFENI